jgi:hypothetical protein
VLTACCCFLFRSSNSPLVTAIVDGHSKKVVDVGLNICRDPLLGHLVDCKTGNKIEPTRHTASDALLSAQILGDHQHKAGSANPPSSHKPSSEGKGSGSKSKPSGPKHGGEAKHGKATHGVKSSHSQSKDNGKAKHPATNHRTQKAHAEVSARN